MAQELIRDGKLERQATAEALQHFLESVVRAARLELKVSVRAVAPGGTGAEGDAEVLADLDGRDKEILLERGAELLKAFEHLAFRALRLSRRSTRKFTSIAAVTARFVLKSCA